MKPLNISYTYLKSTDPHINLAIENKVLEGLAADSMHILFWVNRPCIVMGRFQNPFLECQIDQMIEDDVLIVRRQSGGGCVYHDHGNLNYSFITNKDHHSKDNNHRVIINALKNLGVDAFSTKRVDLFTRHDGIEKKFSGSAFKEKKDTAFHHGTLLINTDLEKLNYYLTPKDLSVQSVSIDSVRSKVVNLMQLNPSITIERVISSVVKEASLFYNVDVSESEGLELDHKHLEKIKHKNWYFGETPKFKIYDSIKDLGELELEIKKMKFLGLSIVNDEVHESFLLELSDLLKGKSLLDNDYIKGLESSALKFEMYSDFINKLIQWLETQFNVLRM